MTTKLPTSQRILLTGASAGIGLVSANRLIDCGHQVWGTSRDVSRLPTRPGFHPVSLDLSDPESPGRAAQKALAEAGSFDVLINNAGFGEFGAVEEFPVGAIEEHFRVLFFSQVALTRAILPSMRAAGRGKIINVTSLSVRLPIPFMTPYSAAKAAFSAFTTGLRMENGLETFRIVDLQPGDIRTSFHAGTRRHRSGPAFEKNADSAWRVIDHNMTTAPDPLIVANKICQLVGHPSPPPVVAVGDLFQSIIAPIGVRVLPQRLMEWAIRKYYGI